MATSYPIKVSPMNMSIPMIQIKLHPVENLNVKSCHCITRLECLKNEFNLKAINIKRDLILKIENLKDEVTSISKRY